MQLKRSGFTHITLAINHLSQLIVAYFGDGARLGVKIDYSLEQGALSTIGPLTLIEDLPENVLVMNGDILCDLDYGVFYKEHLSEQSQVSVSAYRRKVKIDFGVLRTDDNGTLKAFEEKPEYDFDVSMGIYCINKSVIAALPKGKAYGFDDLMIDGIENNMNIDIRLFDGYWLDIGRPDDYEYADNNFPELSAKLGIK